MRYLLTLFIVTILIGSCKKASDTSNPVRAEILGNYHFTTFTYGTATDTLRYNAAITAPNTDDGIKICIPNYDSLSKCELFTTADSTCTSIDSAGPHGTPAYHAYYRHDSIFINQSCYICSYLTIGVKY